MKVLQHFSDFVDRHLTKLFSENYNYLSCCYIVFRIGGRHYGGHAKNGQPIGKASAVMDFNSDLLRGYRGSPGIKIRINQRAFQYASTLARQILDSQISRIQIPDITQRIEEVLIKYYFLILPFL